MNLSNKVKIILFISLAAVNVIIRCQVVPHEIGDDSFWMHIMANSLTEFGHARWILDPLSFAGLYPASYTSAVQFLLSGISQSSGTTMNQTIFVFCVLLGLLSMYTAYLMAGALINDDLYKFLVAFGVSTAPGIVAYTTWTVATRNLVMVLAPLIVYLVLKSRVSVKFFVLSLFLFIFLFVTHHLVYFLFPVLLAYLILVLIYQLKKIVNIPTIPQQVIPILVLIGFFICFLIPFGTGRFLESSRYAPIFQTYPRQIGLFVLPTIGGFGFLVAKGKKSFQEWFLLLSLMGLTIFIYKETYMKWFLPIFVIPLAAISLMNILELSSYRKYTPVLIAVLLILSTSFISYYQFLKSYDTDGLDHRYIEESTYDTGIWLKEYANGTAISNDIMFGKRIFSSSETTHFITSATLVDNIYGFISVNISEFKRYPLTEESFWFDGYAGPDIGLMKWESINMLWESPSVSNITYVVENVNAEGNVVWGHDTRKSQVLQLAYDKGDLALDNGNARIWRLSD